MRKITSTILIAYSIALNMRVVESRSGRLQPMWDINAAKLTAIATISRANSAEKDPEIRLSQRATGLAVAGRVARESGSEVLIGEDVSSKLLVEALMAP